MITNLWMDLFEALVATLHYSYRGPHNFGLASAGAELVTRQLGWALISWNNVQRLGRILPPFSITSSAAASQRKT